MSGYADGRRVEWAVIHDLTSHGYECQRAASSKGVADVIAFKPGQCLLVNVKRTTPPGPAERADLIRVAGYVAALPLVALKPKGTRLHYRLLTGAGPRDWQSWTPDEIGASTQMRPATGPLAGAGADPVPHATQPTERRPAPRNRKATR